MKFLKEIPFWQGLNLIYEYQSEEPLCISLIFDALCKDVVIRNQMFTQYAWFEEVLERRGDWNKWYDISIPAHFKRKGEEGSKAGN